MWTKHSPFLLHLGIVRAPQLQLQRESVLIWCGKQTSSRWRRSWCFVEKKEADRKRVGERTVRWSETSMCRGKEVTCFNSSFKLQSTFSFFKKKKGILTDCVPISSTSALMLVSKPERLPPSSVCLPSSYEEGVPLCKASWALRHTDTQDEHLNLNLPDLRLVFIQGCYLRPSAQHRPAAITFLQHWDVVHVPPRIFTAARLFTTGSSGCDINVCSLKLHCRQTPCRLYHWLEKDNHPFMVRVSKLLLCKKNNKHWL